MLKRFLTGFVAGCILAFLFLAPLSRADEVYNIVIKKQEEKKKARWSISDWLDTRDRMRIQDLWLALHSPSPYEFYFGGNYQYNQLPGGAVLYPWAVHAGAYASIFGLEAQREAFADPRWNFLFHLRVFGYHDQATNLTLEGGVRHTEGPGTSYRSPLAGLGLTLYFGKFFGIKGLGRYHFASTPTATGANVSGYRWEGGAFIEFKVLRIYGDYFQEFQSAAAGAGTTTSNVAGIIGGVRLYL